jgi:hypothetical protein
VYPHLGSIRNPIREIAAIGCHGALALPAELREIYLAGYDAWGDRQPIERYLALCEDSLKYQRGTWYAFRAREGAATPIVTSMICYDLGASIGRASLGIGSIATVEGFRRRGHCTEALRGLVQAYSDAGIAYFLLFPDSDTSAYETVGFRRLSKAMLFTRLPAPDREVLARIDRVPYF